jgi:hypothetical protein
VSLHFLEVAPTYRQALPITIKPAAAPASHPMEKATTRAVPRPRPMHTASICHSLHLFIVPA